MPSQSFQLMGWKMTALCGTSSAPWPLRPPMQSALRCRALQPWQLKSLSRHRRVWSRCASNCSRQLLPCAPWPLQLALLPQRQLWVSFRVQPASSVLWRSRALLRPHRLKPPTVEMEVEAAETAAVAAAALECASAPLAKEDTSMFLSIMPSPICQSRQHTMPRCDACITGMEAEPATASVVQMTSSMTSCFAALHGTRPSRERATSVPFRPRRSMQ
mmetsp:Transcript_104034/g.303707  ORF Transcript_104034/g.303707 Transcript_104034/m.303707 type:complete len:217 (-) Transcript_104034:612-1262(-)